MLLNRYFCPKNVWPKTFIVNDASKTVKGSAPIAREPNSELRDATCCKGTNSHTVIPAIWRKWIRPVLTPAKQAGNLRTGGPKNDANKTFHLNAWHFDVRFLLSSIFIWWLNTAQTLTRRNNRRIRPWTSVHPRNLYNSCYIRFHGSPRIQQDTLGHTPTLRRQEQAAGQDELFITISKRTVTWRDVKQNVFVWKTCFFTALFGDRN